MHLPRPYFLVEVVYHRSRHAIAYRCNKIRSELEPLFQEFSILAQLLAQFRDLRKKDETRKLIF